MIFKNLEWRRPEEMNKDAKFMIIEDEKGSRNIEIDAKHGMFGASEFISGLSIIGTRSNFI